MSRRPVRKMTRDECQLALVELGFLDPDEAREALRITDSETGDQPGNQAVYGIGHPDPRVHELHATEGAGIWCEIVGKRNPRRVYWLDREEGDPVRVGDTVGPIPYETLREQLRTARANDARERLHKARAALADLTSDATRERVVAAALSQLDIRIADERHRQARAAADLDAADRDLLTGDDLVAAGLARWEDASLPGHPTPVKRLVRNQEA